MWVTYNYDDVHEWGLVQKLLAFMNVAQDWGGKNIWLLDNKKNSNLKLPAPAYELAYTDKLFRLK